MILILTIIYLYITAIDVCYDCFESIETIISLGFSRILTSGGKNTALEGSENIKEMKSKVIL